MIVPDFTISVCGSSCNFLFFGTDSFSRLFLLCVFLGIQSCLGKLIARKSKGVRMRPVKRNLHGLPNTEIVKSGTIRQTLLIEQWLIDSQGHGGTTFPAV